MKSTIGVTLSYMKSVIRKSLCGELWDNRDRFDHIPKIVSTKIWNKNMYGKVGKISAQTLSYRKQIFEIWPGNEQRPFKFNEQRLKFRTCTIKITIFKQGLMVVDSGTWVQLWYHGLKRAERESKNKISSTVNYYYFFLLYQRALCRVVQLKFSPDRVGFPFSALTLFPGLFTVPLMRMTDLLSGLNF